MSVRARYFLSTKSVGYTFQNNRGPSDLNSVSCNLFLLAFDVPNVATAAKCHSIKKSEVRNDVLWHISFV